MVIGLMGGIGSGKSTVLQYLKETYQAEIIQSDYVAKEIMQSGHQAFCQIAECFPQVITDGGIDFARLSEIVFRDKEALQKLNAITHPAVVEEICSQISRYPKDCIVVVESALLLGSGLEEVCDELWVVYCEREKRIERLMKNRGYSREKAEEIMKSQPSDEEYNIHADEWIDNTYSEEKTKEQVDILLSTLPCGF